MFQSSFFCLLFYEDLLGYFACFDDIDSGLSDENFININA